MGSPWRCTRPSEVVLFHTSTPVFVRMDLGDGVISDGLVGLGALLGACIKVVSAPVVAPPDTTEAEAEPEARPPSPPHVEFLSSAKVNEPFALVVVFWGGGADDRGKT